MFEKCVSVAPPKAWAASNRSSASNDDGSAIKIDFWAGVYGVVAWIDVGIAGVALLVWLGSDSGESASATAAFVMLVGIAGALSCFFSRTLLRGGADVIRLLKKQNGVPFGGHF